ncbi:hypothetical protein ElyMa_006678200 [Elysia marginata]|uniref:CTNNB1 binding N-teminal domain-containing protein n=1 Tax=Elysia marginata TaxID=1093978 RepID=A0AAV4INC6_9GAST|nr:hypothetical protein ElyMa_006678200 [Elysia marginata]
MQETTLFSREEIEMDNMAERSTTLPESPEEGGKNNSESNGLGLQNGSAVVKSNGSSSHTNGTVIPYRDKLESDKEENGRM